MYDKDKSLLLLSSASAQANNLSASKMEASRTAEAVAVIHGGCVNLTPTDPTNPKTSYLHCSTSADRPSAVVTQVMWCYLGYESVLAVASSQGLQLFDCTLYELIFSHPCNDSAPDKEYFARGLANPPPDYLCVGNNRGTLRLFCTNEDGGIMFVDRKQVHRSPVSDLDSSKDVLVSGDEDGHLALWNVTPDELLHRSTLQTYGCACTSVKLWKGSLVVGYGSGHIRLFSLDGDCEARLCVEVSAHSRWITGMDVALERGYILTVSEDSFAKVWQINRTGDTLTVVHKFSTQVKDCFLIGGKFLTPSGSSFAVSIFDSNIIQCFKM